MKPIHTFLLCFFWAITASADVNQLQGHLTAEGNPAPNPPHSHPLWKKISKGILDVTAYAGSAAINGAQYGCNADQIQASLMRAPAMQGGFPTLYGGVRQNDDFLQGNCLDNLSALGIEIDVDSHMVIFVDPMSDAYGFIEIGDFIKSYDGTDPIAFMNRGLNFGNVGTRVQTEFCHLGCGERIIIRRKAITDFSPYVQSKLHLDRANQY